MNLSNHAGERPNRLFFGSFFSSEKKEHVPPRFPVWNNRESMEKGDVWGKKVALRGVEAVGERCKYIISG